MALQLQDVLEEGAKSTDVPLTPADGDQLGAASAGKGAALIRMMEYALNPKVFDSAVQTFYSRSAGKAVSVDDLYDAFSDAAYNGDSGLDDGVTVVNVWSSWASKAGYPVVTVMRDYENNAITVSQRKFSWASISDRGALGAEDANSEWWVPLSYTYALEQQNDGERLLSPRDWLVPGENDMLLDPIPHLSSDDWVYFNLDQAAPYRVNYDTFNWRMLSRELLGVQFDKTLPAASRAHLLGDALALARAGELDYALALDLAVYLRREDDLLPWQVARRSFTFLEDRLQGDALDWLHQLEALLLKDVYLDAQFGMGGAPEGQNPDVRLLRELAVTWACEAGLQQCLEHADQLYSEWSSGGQAPQADMVEAVLCRAVASRGDDALSFVLTALADDTLAGGQRRSYVRAAACGSTEHLLRRAVSEALVASGPFTSSEVAELLEAATARKPHGWAVVTDFLEKDSTGIQQRTGNEGELERLSLLLASKTTSQSQLDELLRAVAASQGSEDSTLAATIRNEVAVNLAWANLNADLVADWIRVYLNLPPAPTTPAVVPTTATAPTTTTRPTTARPSPPTTPTSTSTTPRGAGSAPVPGFVMWIVSLLAVAAAAPRQRFALLRV
ncbi:aminopeptidase N-like [Thrips palmi]|uniref:Aminopeptidase N-like n=1 Tax=Thrips palmi TaxID=161013 RepID=A0A6P8YCJ5_THRPL|nr:aminopeptidase N-like [Thrips palmi]